MRGTGSFQATVNVSSRIVKYSDDRISSACCKKELGRIALVDARSRSQFTLTHSQVEHDLLGTAPDGTDANLANQALQELTLSQTINKITVGSVG